MQASVSSSWLSRFVEALETEATRLEWKKAEFSPSSSAPPIPQATTPKVMSVPLRSTAEIPSHRATKPYPERDWFRKRSATLAAMVAQRLAKDKADLTRLLTEGAGEVSGATRTSAVESQLSEEDFLCCAKRSTEAYADWSLVWIIRRYGIICCFGGVLEGDSHCIYLLALWSALEETHVGYIAFLGCGSQLGGASVVSVRLWF
jgi:hypothetical protein